MENIYKKQHDAEIYLRLLPLSPVPDETTLDRDIFPDQMGFAVSA